MRKRATSESGHSVVVLSRRVMGVGGDDRVEGVR
jgi:hypothetical protein